MIKIKGLDKTIKLGLFFSLLQLFGYQAISQTLQEKFLYGKENMNAKEYSFAKEYFQQVIKSQESSQYKIYAHFYNALCTYHEGDLQMATLLFKELMAKYPEWPKTSEVYFWLANIAYHRRSYEDAITYVKKTNVESADELLKNIFWEASYNTSVVIQSKYPLDITMAELLANKIMHLSANERDLSLLRSLIDTHELDSKTYNLPSDITTKHKKTYKVAVLLPFMFDGLANPRGVMGNKFITDLYQGIQSAVDSLNESTSKFELYPYDTRRDSSKTLALLNLKEMKSMDLIIGPLFPVPTQLVSKFSYDNKINMINPLGTRADVIQGNPYAYLFTSTSDTRAKMAARLAIDSFANKNAMIFYEDNERDSLNAKIYQDEIEKTGFNVIRSMKLDKTNAQEAFDMLTAKIDNEYLKANLDSVLSFKKSDTVAYYMKDSLNHIVGAKIFVKDQFIIEPDSIGHYYIASSKALYASSCISAAEVRNDSVTIIGRSSWLESEALTFDELELLGVYFIHPKRLNEASLTYQEMKANYLVSFKSLPHKNYYIGHELMSVVGKQMLKYGTYFQLGNDEIIKGNIFDDVYFGGYQSNQNVPVSRLKNSKIELIKYKFDEQPKQ